MCIIPCKENVNCTYPRLEVFLAQINRSEMLLPLQQSKKTTETILGNFRDNFLPLYAFGFWLEIDQVKIYSIIIKERRAHHINASEIWSSKEITKITISAIIESTINNPADKQIITK